MPAVYVNEREPINSKDPQAPRNNRPVKRARIDVTWDIAGETSIVRGYNVAITLSGNTPLQAIEKLQYVDGAANRAHTFQDVEPNTYQAWVQSVAEGGDSPWRKANSELTVNDDAVPTIPSLDHRHIAAYVEDFRAASRPTGFAFSGITDAYVNGELQATTSGGFAAYFRWDLFAWLTAKANLDNDRPREDLHGATLIVKMRIDSASGNEHICAVIYNPAGSSSGDLVANVPIVNDGALHQISVPLGLIDVEGATSLKLDFYPNLGTGATFAIDGIAIAWNTVDLSLSGDVDFAIRGREQFGQDPTYGGLFLQSPVRPAGQSNDFQLSVDANGVFWLRDENGNLVSEAGYKQGRRGRIGPIGAFGSVPFDALPSIIQPVIPRPSAHNKLRVILEPNGMQRTISGSTSAVREFVEMSEFSYNRMQQHYTLWAGGSMGNYVVEAPSGGWSQSSESKSLLLPQTAGRRFRDTIGGPSDFAKRAWYRSENDLPTLTGNYAFYRGIAWIYIQTPDLKKANGERYVVDLTFDAVRGTAVIVSNYMYPSIYVNVAELYDARVLTDGRLWKVPLVYGATTQDIGPITDQSTSLRAYHNILIDWVYFTPEAGASIASSLFEVRLMRLEWDYIDNYTSRSFPLAQGFLYTALEEF